jgi:hypothetical protein
MSYFSLRKPAPESEPEEVVEEPEDVVADMGEETEPPPSSPPVSAVGAVVVGIAGPAQWIAGRFGAGTALAVHIGAVWAVGFYGGWVAVLVPAVWLLAVLAFMPREHLERAADRIEKRGRAPREEPVEADEIPTVDPLVIVLWQLLGDAPGTHLKTVAAHLNATAPEQPVDRAAVRAKLAALQVPVRASVRDAAGRVNEGVHRADLLAWHEALPPTASPAPDQRRRKA